MLFVGNEPKKATKGSAAFDLIANDTYTIQPRESCIISTGTKMAIMPGRFGLVTLRSGHGFNKNLFCHIGIIDSDYRGDIAVKVFNFSDEPVYIQKGDRFAQITFLSMSVWDTFTMVDTLDDTERGEGGFGHTGVK